MNRLSDNDNKERIEANVKWYNPVKGYGFLIRGGHANDIMIHFSTLDAIGCAYVKEGDRVVCEVASGKSGLYVIRVIEVKFESFDLRSLSGFFTSRLIPVDLESLEEIEGTIKWYNPTKGYGFIVSDEGGREVFIHSTILQQAGYKALEPGTRVLAKVFQAERGPEARTIRIIDEKQKQKAV